MSFDLENPTGVGNDGIAQWGTNAGQQLAIFFKGSRHNPTKSVETGSPMFDDVTMIRVITPGDNDGNGVEVEARDWHKQRFPREWDAFQKKQDYKMPGTPLSIMFADSPATVKMFEAKSIYTVQQLATLDDSVIMAGNPMFRQHKTRAQQWLSTALKGAEDLKLRQEKEALEGDLSTAKSDIAELKQIILKMQNGDKTDAKPKGKPGRPKKVAAPEPEVVEDLTINPYDPETYSQGDE